MGVDKLVASIAKLDGAEKEYKGLKGRLERNREQLGADIPNKYRKAFDRLERDVARARSELHSLREQVMEDATDVLIDAVTARLAFENMGEKEKAVAREVERTFVWEKEHGLCRKVNDILFVKKDVLALLDEAKRIRGLILESNAFRGYWDAHCSIADGRPYNDLIDAVYLDEDGMWYRNGWRFFAPAPPSRLA